jgi:alpha-L-fucosidase 2
MLLQSHGGEIVLLPALPGAWATGRVKGLCACGGFVVDMSWREGKLTKARILSRLGNPCRLRAHAQVQVQRDGITIPTTTAEDGVTAFSTEAGILYEILPLLSMD